MIQNLKIKKQKGVQESTLREFLPRKSIETSPEGGHAEGSFTTVTEWLILVLGSKQKLTGQLNLMVSPKVRYPNTLRTDQR